MTTPTNQGQQWTPEPWPEDKDHDSAPDMIWEGNYQRARACVNACAGMTDPIAEIAALHNRVDHFRRDYRNSSAEQARLQKQVEQLREALLFYANPKDWAECRAQGNVMSAKDGEPFMAFDKGEDRPWKIAQQALEQTKP